MKSLTIKLVNIPDKLFEGTSQLMQSLALEIDKKVMAPLTDDTIIEIDVDKERTGDSIAKMHAVHAILAHSVSFYVVNN
jgi:hypothetical protein